MVGFLDAIKAGAQVGALELQIKVYDINFDPTVTVGESVQVQDMHFCKWFVWWYISKMTGTFGEQVARRILADRTECNC